MSDSSLENKLRKEFYEELNLSDLPDKWEVVESTVYTSSPTFRKKISQQREINILVNVTDDQDFSIISMLIIEDENSYESQLGYRWEADSPAQATKYLISDCIPHSENNLS